ncbi:MAG: peptidase caspase catalytic subunit p20 [Myxococcaceae bacterium]|nr:peptidase caspase catalytic subunit p20 [Myxococcaceae bacterium]
MNAPITRTMQKRLAWRWWLTMLVGIAGFVAPSIARAEPVRILVSAGNKQGLVEERPLKYADGDAQRVRDVLVGLGGVRPNAAFVLAAPTRAQLFAAIDRAKDEAKKHRPDEVTLVFYFSGHGDREALHLGDERVLLTDLTAKLGEVPAGLRIAVTDACRTTREKGFVSDEPFAISATTSTQASGQVWLHASSDGEAAQESDELQGAIFTHSWLNGLRGAADTNGDSRVTLEESFAFAHSQTLIRSSKSSGVMQKPEAIVSLRELSPVVLTQTAAHMATLSLPQARDTHFLVYAATAKSVLSELWGSPDRRIALSVPPGRYVIQRRFASTGSAATIAITAGEERKLEESDFSASSLDVVARKGDGVEPDRVNPPPPERTSRHELSAGYEAGSNTRTGFVQGPRVGYAYAWSKVAIGIGAGADLASRTLPDTTESLVTGFGRATFELRLPMGNVLALRMGGGARAGWMAQTIEHQTTPPIAATRNGAFVMGPEVFAALRTSIGTTLFADLSASGNVLFLNEEGKTRGVPGGSGAAALGAQF